MGLADRIFGSHIEREARIRDLGQNATASLYLFRYWRAHSNPRAAAGELAHMDEALDALLEMGVGR